MTELALERTQAVADETAAETSPTPAAPMLVRCPVCGRADALVAVGDALFCAACGYASDGAAGCT